MNAAMAVGLMATIIIGATLIRACLRSWHSPVARRMALLTTGVVWWSLANLVEVVSVEPTTKLLAARAAWLGIVAVPIMWWALMTSYAGAPRLSSPAGVAVAGIIALPTIALVATADPQHALWTSMTAAATTGSVATEFGPWFVVHSIWAYALVLSGLAVGINRLRGDRRVHRQQAAILVAVVAVPLIANAIAIMATSGPMSADPTPIALAFSLAGLAVSVQRLRLLDLTVGILPVARNAVIDAMRDGVVVVDRSGRVVDVNPAAVRLLGRPSDAAIGQRATAIVPGNGDHSAAESSWELRADSGRLLRASATPLRSGGGTLIMLDDITEQREREQQLFESMRRLTFEARHDSLTGLANRRLVFEELDAALNGPRGSEVCVLAIDLDGFKAVNDALGHAVGDATLQRFAGCLQKVLPADAVVGRLGGDEFAVIVVGDLEQAVAVADRIAASTRIPLHLGDTPFAVAVSVGVARSSRPGHSADDLMHRADVAMYDAKRSGARVAIALS